MKIVLPFFEGDKWLILKNLAWMAELDTRIERVCFLAADNTFIIDEVLAEAQKVFGAVGTIRYDRAYHNGKLMLHWPWQQNNSFVNVARRMAQQSEPWLWLETDAVPLKPKWVETLEEDYTVGNKPFGGHVNVQNGVFNGVAIYPPDVIKYTPKAFRAALIVDERQKPPYQPPWDAYISGEVRPHLHMMNRVMQHFWNLPGQDQAPHFKDIEMVKKWVRPDVVLYHRCKDGSLIDRLREIKQANIELQLKGTDVVKPPVPVAASPPPIAPGLIVITPRRRRGKPMRKTPQWRVAAR